MRILTTVSRLLAVAALSLAWSASAVAAPSRTVPLQVETGRSTTLTVWELGCLQTNDVEL